MTIVSEVTQWPVFIFCAVGFVIITLLAATLAIGAFMSASDPGDVITGVLIASVAVLLVGATTVGISIGPNVHVYAIVDDWNAVHDAGYEVIEQQGDLITLRKAQS